MIRPSFLCLLSVLVSGSLLAEETSTQNSSTSESLKELPALKDTGLPEAKSYAPKQSTDALPTANAPARPTPAYSKEQLEALNKERNWAVEGLKDRRETERLQLEKAENTEKTSIDDLLEKERKSIDERLGKSTSSMNQLKPSIQTDWDAVNGRVTSADKELAAKKDDLQALNQLNNWNSDSFSNRKDNPQAFAPSLSQQIPPTSSTTNNTQNNLQNLQNELNASKARTDSDYDYLVNSGQTQNFRKLSSDPNFQPSSTGNLVNQPSIDAVPSVPKPVTSTMSVETLRQIELQRVNALPKPDFKELNSRIPDPGSRRF